MKSRISYFDKGILRKDITRFAPLWAIYLAGGLLVMLSFYGEEAVPGAAAYQLPNTIGPFSIINMIYAMFCAQMLFGDLFNTRLCNALHAMPLRRECWFVTHTVAGLAFSLVPHFIGAVCLMPFFGEFWYIPALWWVAMTLEYVLFFGLAVFSVFLTGNRFAAAAVYAILNFASMIAYWFVFTIYEPLLPGIVIPQDVFHSFSPVTFLTALEGRHFLELERFVVENTMSVRVTYRYEFLGLGDTFWYLPVVAAVGIGLLACSLVLYRRRKLECAGDFIAARPLGPIFCVVFTLTMGCLFSLFTEVFSFDSLSRYLFIPVGIVIGYFSSVMLVNRAVKVFRKKVFLGFAGIAIALTATIGLTAADPLGLTRWVPTLEQVKSAQVYNGSALYAQEDDFLEFTEEEDIRTVLAIHHNSLSNRETNRSHTTITLRYQLRSGITVTREYPIYPNTTAWNFVKILYGTPEIVLGYEDWDYFLSSVEDFRIHDIPLNKICLTALKEDGLRLDPGELQLELLEAMRKDCEAGHLTQNLRRNETVKYWISYEYRSPEGYSLYRYLDIYEDAECTLAVLEQYKDYIKYE